MKRGILTVVSGFSGAGKGTLMKALLAKYDNYATYDAWLTENGLTAGTLRNSAN